ncbi:hypothetical protein [Trichococcus ilyis]|uniref:Uncharacterized protein n=1 Tax=Trichococcus ilyis TaxID=640938 RepID=A0A143ZBT2_9LACT|nr:hypothetical protein [Trichococcus ilyis]CZR09463.1 Hypothetical protein TR210_2727 [Trichococcus ilyis]SEJ96332.1 hypothetical protein SAMN05216375_1488 [Trichococcus ilyis]
MTNTYAYNCYLEFEKLKQTVSFDKTFMFDNEIQIKRIFKRIYVINLLKNRPELKNILDEKFDMTFTLLLESSYSLFSGQCRSSLLLLRSSLESGLQFVTRKEREWILETVDQNIEFDEIDYRFVETKKKLIKDISPYVAESDYPEYYLTIDRCVSYYKKLCEIVHSTGSAIPINISYFYANLNENTLINKEKFFDLYSFSLDTLFTLLYFLLRLRLKEWDTYELKDILNVLYRDDKTEKYLNFVKI